MSATAATAQELARAIGAGPTSMREHARPVVAAASPATIVAAIARLSAQRQAYTSNRSLRATGDPVRRVRRNDDQSRSSNARRHGKRRGLIGLGAVLGRAAEPQLLGVRAARGASCRSPTRTCSSCRRCSARSRATTSSRSPTTSSSRKRSTAWCTGSTRIPTSSTPTPSRNCRSPRRASSAASASKSASKTASCASSRRSRTRRRSAPASSPAT